MRQSMILAALAVAVPALAQLIDCDLDNPCPESAPCCSQFGQCGVGAYCLGGCDPRMSFSYEACVPAPVCQDSQTTFENMDSILDIGDFLGDANDGTWVGQGEPRIENNNLYLTMPEDSHGSLISSTAYLWYGNVKARMKSSRGKGVITAFILFSDIKDEIDYEWVGVDLETAQTNFYFQGITNYTNSENLTITDSFSNFHDYELDWTPERIQWIVNGEVERTVEREGTFNSTSNQYEYPQTPARVQLSIWPGGLPDNAEGTINWAGGVIDWNHEDVVETGFYYVTIESIDITCYGADTAPGTNNGVSYTYEEGAGTNDTIIDSDAPTVLGSLMATGLDMDKGKKEEDDEDDDDDDDEEAVGSIPGEGIPSTPNVEEDETTESNEGNPAGSFGGTTPPAPDSCNTGSFHMSCDSGGGSEASTDDGDGEGSGSRASASALAMIIAGSALFWL